MSHPNSDAHEAKWAASIRLWTPEPPSPEVRAALERVARAPGVVHVAGMPDLHLAQDVCVGCVVATERWLYPQAVGGDIGCGISALRFDGPAEALGARQAAWLLSGLRQLVPGLKHRDAQDLPRGLGALSHARLRRLAEREGRHQLGTLGRGNHFLELQRDEAGALWAVVHSGSRALGPAIRDHHLGGAEAVGGGLLALEAERPEGEAYLADHALAIAWAAESRRRMLTATAALVEAALGFQPAEERLLECAHNHVRVEEIDGRALWVHRKGAAPARLGEPALIPGSMGSPSYLVLGRGAPEGLLSSSHGAGRRLSRSEARRRVRPKDLARQTEGVWLDRRRAAEWVEEAPEAYKDIGAVMRAQRDLTKVVGRLEPVLNHRA